ncbi:DUF4168 domain-containing protein [Nostoc sp. CCY0012]|uniref:DUF4168 domain-containing protein n=1 Tax=Nostoc sp. CCY0012 TaxID=1056123 RepID=UPI0039C6D0FF
MKRITNLFCQNRLSHLLSQSLFFGMIATASVVGSLTFSSKAGAQTASVNNADIDSYAQAVLAMETPRQQAFEEIKRLVGSGDMPRIVCNDPNSMSALPRKAQTIAVNYCNRSQQIVEENGLSIDRFNNITVELQNNNNLKRQVYNSLIRLQKTPESR